MKRAATVALVVGTLLNLINHHELLFGAALTPKVLVQILLTYLVPYVVSTHGQIAGAFPVAEKVQGKARAALASHAGKAPG